METKKLSPQEFERIAASAPAAQSDQRSASQPNLLQLLAPVERNLLNDLITEHTLERGQILFREGDAGNAAYLIWSGRLAILKGAIDSPTLLGYRGPGEILGEMALLEGRTRSATAVAVEPARLLQIDRAGFQQLLNQSPALGIRVMETLSSRLRAADDARTSATLTGRQLAAQVTRLQTDKEQLLAIEQLRQQTSDLIVHDLRNPLNVISGVLQMLDMTLPPEVREANQELLQVAGSACSRIQRLVDSLLDAARLESGQIQLNISRTDLADLIDQVLKREQMSFARGGIIARADIPAGLGPVPCDPEMIDRVLANLIDNAIKYTPDHGTITIQVEQLSDRAVVRVSDTGPGVPPDQRDRVFGRFAQLEDDRQYHGSRGFGLGLSFCRLAVEAHGGKIWVQDGPAGQGSSFCFSLPLTTRGRDPAE